MVEPDAADPPVPMVTMAPWAAGAGFAGGGVAAGLAAGDEQDKLRSAAMTATKGRAAMPRFNFVSLCGWLPGLSLLQDIRFFAWAGCAYRPMASAPLLLRDPWHGATLRLK